jgi:dihydrofolate reductase
MITVIVAMTPGGVIGADGQIPWHYSADMRRFKRVTLDSTLIVGRKTWQTLPALKRREIIVLTRNPSKCVGGKHPPVFTACVDPAPGRGGNMALFLRWVERSVGSVYVAGGAEIYALALESGLVDVVDITTVPVPDSVSGNLSLFPMGMLDRFQLVSRNPNPEEPRLIHYRYERDGG